MSEHNDAPTPSRRKHRRHSSAIKATAYTDPDVRISALIRNISYEGLQLALDPESATQLLQNALTATDHEHTRLSIEFVVNNQDQEPSAIHILCRIVHIDNSDEQLCVIGLEHRDIEEGVMALSEFIISLPD